MADGPVIAKVIADSITPHGRRLTTVEATIHRFVLAELNTHRVFSRNSASSRAIPLVKQLDRMADNPAWPVSWPAEQPGMQGGAELDPHDLTDAQNLWQDVYSYTWERVSQYLNMKPSGNERLHKSVVNRLLEPFMYHTVIISATEWDGFFAQRCSPLAQPEIRIVAEAIRDAITLSEPVTRYAADGLALDRADWMGWHLPYMTQQDLRDCASCGEDPRHVSAMRCARVSYLTHDGVRDVQVDAEKYRDLVSASPPHWSPLEHVARPAEEFEMAGANFRGWVQLRTITEGTLV